MSTPTFEPAPDRYDALIDWPGRLANESPFYRLLFDRYRIHSLLDTACGSGRHAAMFRDWGLLVEGADSSAAMIAHARERFGECDELRWVQRSFTTRPPRGTFDAALCVGNSLALAPDMAAVRQAVAAMLAAVRPGGIVVLQVLNLWRLAEGQVRWNKPRQAVLGDTEHVLLKGIHRADRRGYINLIDTTHGPGGPMVEQAEFLGIRRSILDRMARRAGADNTVYYGDYAFGAYDEASSTDLVAVLQRAEGPKC